MTEKTLSELLKSFSKNIPQIPIQYITNNSRDVIANSLFIAYPGAQHDGRKYIENAVQQGATAIAYEPPYEHLPSHIPCIPISHVSEKLSLIASRFYDDPSKDLPIVGVTGTNGKTSITQFIAQCIEKCGVIGTMGYGFYPPSNPLKNTTPDGLELQKIIHDFKKKEATSIAMEVSSHALSLHRVDHIHFQTAVFSNLTQDHLDFHGTMENYRDAKGLLFQKPHLKNAVINMDDESGRYYIKMYQHQLPILTYSLKNPTADIYCEKYESIVNGFNIFLHTPWGKGTCELKLVGEFNIANVLAVIGVLGAMNVSWIDILKRVSLVKPIHGRMEIIKKENYPVIVIDYAHTPDALEKALQQLKRHCNGQLWCVFGCGGERDATKRPIMGGIAERYAEHIILTNDNPRSEDQSIIVSDILKGIQNKHKAKIELDRGKAIQYAIQSAKATDWVLIAGKGHETEQIIGSEKIHHSDVACVREVIG